MGKYYCIILTKDNRRIVRVIDLKAEMFGFLNQSRIEKMKHHTRIDDDPKSKIQTNLPNVEIIPIESESFDLIQKFECATGILLCSKLNTIIILNLNSIVIKDALSSIKWYKKDGEFSSKITIEKNILKIFNFNKEDYGYYICIATNENGSQQASIYLGEDYETYYDTHIDVKSNFNRAVNLVCNTSKWIKQLFDCFVYHFSKRIKSKDTKTFLLFFVLFSLILIKIRESKLRIRIHTIHNFTMHICILWIL